MRKICCISMHPNLRILKKRAKGSFRDGERRSIFPVEEVLQWRKNNKETHFIVKSERIIHLRNCGIHVKFDV